MLHAELQAAGLNHMLVEKVYIMHGPCIIYSHIIIYHRYDTVIMTGKRGTESTMAVLSAKATYHTHSFSERMEGP